MYEGGYGYSRIWNTLPDVPLDKCGYFSMLLRLTSGGKVLYVRLLIYLYG